VQRAEEGYLGYVVGDHLFPHSELSDYTPLYTGGASSSQCSILVASIKRSDIINDSRTDIRTVWYITGTVTSYTLAPALGSSILKPVVQQAHGYAVYHTYVLCQ
jgi:hypothetical protein